MNRYGVESGTDRCYTGKPVINGKQRGADPLVVFIIRDLAVSSFWNPRYLLVHQDLVGHQDPRKRQLAGVLVGLN